VAYSSRKLLQNYTSTIIQALSFKPTPYSRTVFNSYFSANQFAAIGLKPIYNLTKDFHLRGEVYCFVPYQNIERAVDNSAYYSPPFSSARFMGETSVVYNFKIGSAGLYLNYCSAGTSQWNFGLNIGILLFNNKFIE
jgi:NTE family protein